MFRKKQTQKREVLSFYNGPVRIFYGDWTQLPFKETVILEKSQLFFSDPTPCYIHRGAVQMRLIGELQMIMEEKSAVVTGNDIPRLLLHYVDLPLFDRLIIEKI